MAPNKKKKVAAAFEKMKEFGISKVKVKKALEELLKVYCNKWEFIEEDNYRVLIEAVLERKDEDKGTECNRKEAGSTSKKNDAKSPKEAQICDDPLIFELQKKRLRPRNQKGKEENPVKKLKASLMLEKDEGELSEGEEEEDAGCGLVKRKYARNKMQVVVYEDSMYHGENSLRGQEDGLSSCEDCEPLRKRSRTYNNKEEDRDFLKYQRCMKKQPFSEFSIGKEQPETCNILDFYHNDCLDFSSGEAYDHDLPLDEVPLKLIHPAASEVTEDETRLLKFENVDDKGSCVSSTSQCDIASSSKGEVKVSLIYNPSQSDLHIPSLDDVLKAVEEKYKLFKIIDSDFSVKKLMSDVCQYFFAMATPSSVDKGSGTNNMSLSKVCDGKDNDGNNFGNLLSYSNVSFHNLVRIVPPIPNIVALSGVEGLQYTCGFRIPDIVITKSHRQRKIKFLESTEFSNSSFVAGIEKEFGSSAAKHCYIDDITRGEEKVEISLENSFCAEQLPHFYYTKHNLIYDKANVKFSLARISDVECCSHCFGDCLGLSLPCACACLSGGDYAYTQEGLLKEKFLEECISLVKDPKEHNFFYCKRCPVETSKNKQKVKHCKGHLQRKFIKECWSKCGCNKNCGNRVVQRGITANLQVFWTPEGKGWGIRTLADLPKGAFVCEYVGEVVTNTELYERTAQSIGDEKHAYSVPLDGGWFSENILNDEEALCLDATLYGNVARFISHRCTDASLIEIPVEVETPDHHYYHLAFFTRRKVAAMEELTWDYGIDFTDQDQTVNAFRCRCNSPLCRDQRQKKI